MSIPHVHVFRIRFRPSSDGKSNRISVLDCKTMAVHYIPYDGDAINFNSVQKLLLEFGFVITGQFEYKGDEFVIVQPN